MNSVRKHNPSSQSDTPYPTKEYRTVFETLLIGTFCLLGAVTFLLLVSYFLLGNTHVASRIFVCVGCLFYLAVTYRIWKRGRLVVSSYLLILFYFSIAAIILLGWGINLPFGLLILAIGIVLSGILLGAPHTLYAATVAIIIMFVVQGLIGINGSPLFAAAESVPSHFGDVIAHSILLAVLALIAWLFGRQTEHLFLKSRQAEQALNQQNRLLEIRVRKRTQELRKAQLDEMEQLYEFAEMGQLSAALLHDLAGHLSVLNFDIADLKKYRNNQPVKHLEESISYLEQAINKVHKQLKGKNDVRDFNVVECLRENVKILTPRANAQSITLSLVSDRSDSVLYGDPLRLSHIVNILIQNAIEAYENTPLKRKKRITLTVIESKKTMVIKVRDNGLGIPLSKRDRLFAPLHTTKKDGLGIGLFIARKITETHFKGTLNLDGATDYTEFVIEIPKKVSS